MTTPLTRDASSSKRNAGHAKNRLVEEAWNITDRSALVEGSESTNSAAPPNGKNIRVGDTSTATETVVQVEVLGAEGD